MGEGLSTLRDISITDSNVIMKNEVSKVLIRKWKDNMKLGGEC